jgi:hypothetical protein
VVGICTECGLVGDLSDDFRCEECQRKEDARRIDLHIENQRGRIDREQTLLTVFEGMKEARLWVV